MRGRFLEGQAGIRIDQVLGEMAQGVRTALQHSDGSLSKVQGGHDRIPDPLGVTFGRFEFIDQQFDEMALVAVQCIYLIQGLDFSVHPYLRIATSPELVEQLAVVSLAAPYERSQEIALLPLVALHDQVHNLLVGIADHLLAGSRGISPGSPCVEQAEEIEYLRDGSDCRAGIVACGLLLYRNDGAEAVDAFHLRLLEDSHEVPGIGGQGVHIAPLAFGIDGIEGKGRLPAAAESGHHDELIAGDVHVHTFKIVGLGPTYLYIFLAFTAH